jgi:hypothetical protein
MLSVGVFAESSDHELPKNTSAHGRAECSTCHQVVASIGSTQPILTSVQQCRTCHDPARLTTNKFLAESFHQDPSRPCRDCHSFHESSTISATGTEFRFSQSTGMALCVSCHSGNGSLSSLSEGHLIAAKLYHSNADVLSGLTASEACLVCHSENRTVQIDGLVVSAIPQFSERHMHPLGEIKSTGLMRNGTMIRPTIDARLHLFNNRIECQTCHQLTANTRYCLASFESREELCKGCHRFE